MKAPIERIRSGAVTCAKQMVRLVTRPSTADLMDLVAESSFVDLELDEVHISSLKKLSGVSVQETEAQRRHRLLVVAVQRADGVMMFNPAGDYRFQGGDVAIVTGRVEDIERFRAEYTP